MKRIATFEKVSYKQFLEDWLSCFPLDKENKIKKIYDNIQPPKRATSGSAGYDFFSPTYFEIGANQTIKFPTGIRVKIEDGWVLKCYPRSSLGFKYKLQLNNTVGIIDSDYYYSDNEGHIFVKLNNGNNENKTVQLKPHDGFMQGIFVEYGVTFDDDVTTIRNGGLGSTTKKEQKSSIKTDIKIKPIPPLDKRFAFPDNKILKVFLVDKDFLEPENLINNNHYPFHTMHDNDNIVVLCYDAIFTCCPVDEKYLRLYFSELDMNHIQLKFQYSVEMNLSKKG